MRGLVYVDTHRDEMLTFAKAEFPTASDEDLKASLDRSFADGLYSTDGFIPQESWTTGETIVLEAGILKEHVSYDQVIDMRFVNDVQERAEAALSMLDRIDIEPLFFAPFVSSVMQVEPAWIDYNGHLNMAYYNVLFDRAVDEAYRADRLRRRLRDDARHSTFTAEVHVRYLRELHAGDPVRVTFQLLDYDAKRMHYFEQLFHAAEGWVSATSENMSLHVDMAAKKTAAFPDRHRRLPRPDEGRARQAAGAGSGRPAHRDAGQILSLLLPSTQRCPRKRRRECHLAVHENRPDGLRLG